MNPYNGFTPHQRMQAFHWLKAEIAAGRRSEAAQCDCCGQTRGILELHSEDYGAPYGDHIGAYQLCYCCHMAVHCRTKNPAAWARYLVMVMGGERVKPFRGRDFKTFCALVLNGPTPAEKREQADGAHTAVFRAIELKAALPHLLAGRAKQTG